MSFFRRKPVVLHIMLREKHASGYISFLKLKLPEYKHVFAIRDKGFTDSLYYELDLPNNDNVYIIDAYNDIFSDPVLKRTAREAKIIIFSGIWYAAQFMEELMMHPDLLQKTWLQFWGGDYFRYQSGLPKNRAEKKDCDTLFRAFRECAGLIFLTAGEYDQFHRITKVENRHIVVPVPKDPRRKIPSFDKDRNQAHTIPRIIVGNSANRSSNHLRVFELLHSAYPNEVFDVICPLSYGGNAKYIDEVVSLGRAYFSNHFIPLLQYMESDEYFSLLAGCDLAVYDFERQQGLGNISALFRAGKKVYLNPASPLWESLPARGCVLFSIEEIGIIPFQEFLFISESDRQKNIDANDPVKRDALKVAQWKTFLQA